MGNILEIIIIMLKHFFDPKNIKKREEKKIEKETNRMESVIDDHINEMDASIIASDIDDLLSI